MRAACKRVCSIRCAFQQLPAITLHGLLERFNAADEAGLRMKRYALPKSESPKGRTKGAGPSGGIRSGLGPHWKTTRLAWGKTVQPAPAVLSVYG